MSICYCLTCGKEFKKRTGKKYCCHKCYVKTLIGKPAKNMDGLKLGRAWNKGIKMPECSGSNHPLWKGGKFNTSNGYIWLSINGERELEHRRIIEIYLGRKLGRLEYVHHINGNRKDNHISNLELMTAAEHTRFHSNERYGNV